MSAITVDESVDVSRRNFLIKATVTMTVAGVATTAVPFISSWQPTEAMRLSAQPARIDITKIGEGEGIKFLWRGTPIWVVHRSAGTVAQLESLRSELKDPDSMLSEQPSYIDKTTRARRSDVIVLTAICTHLGCIPEFKTAGDPDIGPTLNGGFFCPCHGSRYDGAGRVLKGSPAPTNLAIPAHYFADASTLVVGADSERSESSAA